MVQLYQVIDSFFESANFLLASADRQRTVGGIDGLFVHANQDSKKHGEIFDQILSTVRIQGLCSTLDDVFNRNQKLCVKKYIYLNLK